MHNTKLISILTVLLLSACQVTEFNKLSFLEGTWTRKTEKKQNLEIWKQVNHKTFEGKGIRLKNTTGDTLFIEYLQIIKQEGSVFYVAKVPDQNQGKFIFFELKSIQNNMAVFENKKHDFPQKLEYSLKEGQLHIKVSGIENQKKREFELVLDKKK